MAEKLSEKNQVDKTEQGERALIQEWKDYYMRVFGISKEDLSVEEMEMIEEEGERLEQLVQVLSPKEREDVQNVMNHFLENIKRLNKTQQEIILHQLSAISKIEKQQK